MKTPIQVIEPLLPPLSEFIPFLETIWEKRWLTNAGHFHQELEIALASYLNVPCVSLFNNGTTALLAALRALSVKGEVITTPFSFVATSHVISLSNLIPVFADIDSDTFNLSSTAASEFISRDTGALLPVHCYGTPCDEIGFSKLSAEHSIPLIYDAAHAFAVRKNGKSILNWGNLSVLSFHATKVFNTFEGGAIISHDKAQKKLIDNFKNFGIENEITISSIGLNGKMTEIQAAFGMLQLRHIDEAIKFRTSIDARYRQYLCSIEQIIVPERDPSIRANGGYFPILVRGNDSENRDTLFGKLRSEEILCRRYFYPLLTNLSMYSGCKGASVDRLPVANRVANQILCLPIHTGMTGDQVDRISDVIRKHFN